ncbi:MAG: hypothetical protein GX443_05205 [Deltaproteobacteria bacterium]|nr:hypothetical protein [Deltaproteobacteria bacterium]
MQANPINAAQLMMEFLEKEQTDIGQGIVTSEFSRELEHQQLKLEGRPLAKSREHSSETSPTSLLQAAYPANDPKQEKDAGAKEGLQRKTDALKRLATDRRAAEDASSQVRDQVFVTDPALLNKVLADLKLPAEARKVCAASEDNQGKVSLGDLMSLLERHSADAGVSGLGRANGADLRALFASLTLPGSAESVHLVELIEKPKGTYSLDELRQVLGKAVQKIQGRRTNASSPIGGNAETVATSRVSFSTTGGGFTSNASPGQSAHLVKSSLPSFLKEKQVDRGNGEGGALKSLDARLTEGVERGSSQGRADILVKNPDGEESISPPFAAHARSAPADLFQEGRISENQKRDPIVAPPPILPGNEGSTVAGGPGHEAQVPLRALSDILGAIAQQVSVMAFEKNTSEDILKRTESTLSNALAGDGGNQTAASVLEALGMRERSQDRSVVNPSVVQGETEESSDALPPVVSGRTMDARTTPRSDAIFDAPREGPAPQWKMNAEKKDFLPPKPTDTETELKLESEASTEKGGKTLKEKEPESAAVRSASPQALPVKASGKPAGSGPGTAEAPPTAETRASSVERSLQSGAGETTDSESVSARIETVPESSQPEVTGFQEDRNRKIQLAGVLSRLDGMPLEESDNSVGSRALESKESGTAAVDSQALSEASLYKPWVSRLNQGAKADLQPTNGTAGPESPVLEAGPAGFDSRSSQSGDPGSGQYSSPFQQNPSPSVDPVISRDGERLSFLSSSWQGQMVQIIRDLAKERRGGQLTLELEPRELGRLTLRVGTKSDEVIAHVSAEKEQAREILLRNTSVLRQQLEEQGLTLGRFNVDVQDRGADGRYRAQGGLPGGNLGRASRITRQEATPRDVTVQLMKESEERLISIFA